MNWLSFRYRQETYIRLHKSNTELPGIRCFDRQPTQITRGVATAGNEIAEWSVLRLSDFQFDLRGNADLDEFSGEPESIVAAPDHAF